MRIIGIFGLGLVLCQQNEINWSEIVTTKCQDNNICCPDTECFIPRIVFYNFAVSIDLCI